MKIAIDFREAFNNRGIGRYVREIVLALSKIDTENQYLLYVTSHSHKLHLPDNFKFKVVSGSNIIHNNFSFVFFEQILLPIQIWRDKPSILWCPGNTFPLIRLPRKTKLFVTIHDLIFYDNLIKPKELFRKLGKRYRKIMIDKGIKKIQTIFTVSEYSKQSIREQFGLNNIVVTYNMIENFVDIVRQNNFQNIPSLKNITENSDYFYTVSGSAPSKNLDTLLQVYKEENISIPLIITGIKDHKNDRIALEVNKLELSSKIFLTPRIADEQIAFLYKNCKAFIFISKAEGFGIPILEAMCFHKPIVVSNTTSIPEVVGNGGILCDPLDVKQIAFSLKNIDSLFTNDHIAAQDNQLKKFCSWKHSAQTILETFVSYGK